MYIIDVHNDELVIFQSWFQMNNTFHDYETRQSEEYHIPCFITNLGQSSLRFPGAKIWNSIHKLGIAEIASEFSFSKQLNIVFWLVNYEMKL